MENMTLSHEDKCRIGELARKCDEKHKEIIVDDDGRIRGFKIYGRAKDFKKVKG